MYSELERMNEEANGREYTGADEESMSVPDMILLVVVTFLSAFSAIGTGYLLWILFARAFCV